MNFDLVENKGFFYNLVRIYVSWFHNTLFYRKIESTGRKKINLNKPILMAPNHQNALMDPLAVMFTMHKANVFMTRADIFAKPFIINTLLYFKMLPIYRIRDGKESLALNEKIFQKSIDVLEKKLPLVIFPEATHTEFRSLLPLKKGIFRITFAAEEKNNFNLDTQIYPIGINYSNYFNYQTDLLVKYGEPIAVKDYEEIYKENPAKAMQKIRKDLGKKIAELAIDIRNKEHYEFYEKSREIFDFETLKDLKLEKDKSLDAKFKADKLNIKILDHAFEFENEKFINLTQKVENYTQKLKKHNFKDGLFDKTISVFKPLFQSILAILLLPLWLVSAIEFSLPIYLTEKILPNFKDRQFHSSLRLVGSLFISHIMGLIIFTLLWIFTDEWWVKWAFLSLQAPMLLIFLRYIKLVKKNMALWHFFLKNKAKEELFKDKNEIRELFQELKLSYKQKNS